MKNKLLKNTLRVAFILVSIGSLAFVPWILVKAWILPLPNTVQEQVNDALNYGFDGSIVYVDQGGEPPAFYAAGWHNREKKIPANPHALFKIASISKLYVAVAITKLVKAERLSLNDKLTDYFPELKGRIENAEKISIKLMVQHRSGIPNFTDNPDFWSRPPGSSDEALDYAIDLPANFQPDQDYGYSNTNYLLLSRIIEQVVGYSRQQYFEEEILTPLGLKNTFGSVNDVDLERVMSGYYVGEATDFKTVDQGMLATAEDVGIFLRALNDGSVFKDGEQDIYSSIYEYKHSGLVPGYQSLAEYHHDIDTVVVQFTNTTDFNGYNWNLSQILYGRIVKIIEKNRAK